MLKDKILNREAGLLFYGITPPKLNNDPEKFKEIAAKQMDRLRGKPIDGLILYDIQDESSRTDMPRPFPYLRTLSPQIYADEYLTELEIPKIVYRSVGNYSQSDFENWIEESRGTDTFSVFVGAPSKDQQTPFSLSQAYQVAKDAEADVVLGGVTIPERHDKKEDEHMRILYKTAKGCRFFVSQCVYSLTHAKNLLADYFYYIQKQQLPAMPIIFTLTPCGSFKTLEFMQWLGIDIPKWLYKELKYADDPLEKSLDVSRKIADELLDYAIEKNIPIGFNIESVAIRKSEIEASIQLLEDVKAMMDKKYGEVERI
ncbi:hypothetical protein V6R21_19125 [Limibacter armeniacum]|uniref:methylenetetrahydrofolate reductase n=1 Tax=Limibacter armeniacum TaxID=466084 RepID=UPI002FE54050